MNDTDLPAWATDPRGLPPTVHGECRQWRLNEDGTYGCPHHTPAELEALLGPLTPLWPDTPPTSIDPADIKVGMRVRRTNQVGGVTTSREGLVHSIDGTGNTACVRIGPEGRLGLYVSSGDWLLIEDAPDPDEQLVEEVIGASTEQEARELIAMLREQDEARR